MQALVTVNGVALPEPSTYNATSSTIVDSARNVNGVVVGSVVRKNVSKVEVSWRYLTVQQWSNVLKAITDNFYNSVTFFSQTTGGYETKTMYHGDPSCEMWRRDPQTGDVMGWVNCAISLIEV